MRSESPLARKYSYLVPILSLNEREGIYEDYHVHSAFQKSSDMVAKTIAM